MIEYTVTAFNEYDWSIVHKSTDPKDIAVFLTAMQTSGDFSKAQVRIQTLMDQTLIPPMDKTVSGVEFLAECGIVVTVEEIEDDKEEYYDPDDDDSPWYLDPNVSGE